MKDTFFTINGSAKDTEKIEKDIEAAIKKKEESGAYSFLSATNNCKLEFLEIKDEKQFMQFYLDVIKTSWAIDINDFEIPTKKNLSGKLTTLMKKIIWKLLKFYTYRLFSQQIEFNSQIKNTIEALHQDYTKKIESLEKEIQNLTNNKNRI